MGTFIINLKEDYVFFVDGTKSKYQLQSTRTKGQSIVHVDTLMR